MVSALERRGIKFKSEELSFPQEFKDKVNGLKYTSRSEAISHLQGEIDVPEQEVVAFLRKEKDLLESKLNAVISEKDDLKSRLDKIESDKSILQDRLGALEQDFALQKSLISKGGL
ncbi:MAG TPA: hypothetical protein DCZ10_16665 [Pelotomaculum sp.]|nr:hypothetical protein [Pelotomaculum sp.]